MILSPGGPDPLPNSGFGGHSTFPNAIMQSLNSNEGITLATALDESEIDPAELKQFTSTFALYGVQFDP
jgi:hypothetical protein